MKIAWRGITLVVAITVTVLAATGKTQPNRIEYTVLWALVTLGILNHTLDAILEKLRA
jgi:hypothetical protein